MTNENADSERQPDGGYATRSATTAETARPSWRRQVAAVAHTEYRLAVRNRWALTLTAAFALFGTMLSTFSGSAVGPDGLERIVASLTSLAVYLVPLAALAFGYDAIVGRDEEGWLAVVFSLPTTRARVVLGTFFGRAVVLASAIIVGFGVVGLVLVRDYGTARWEAFLAFLVGTVAIGTVFLALAVLVSTVVREKTHALGGVLIAWVWFALIHDLLALGVVSAFSLSDGALSGMVLANPATAFRVFVMSTLETTGGAGFAAALAQTGLSTGLTASALVVWTVVPVAAACLLVRRRRL